MVCLGSATKYPRSFVGARGSSLEISACARLSQRAALGPLLMTAGILELEIAAAAARVDSTLGAKFRKKLESAAQDCRERIGMSR